LKIDLNGSIEVVESGKSFEIKNLSSVKTISLVIKEEMDVIFPRSDAIVRHNIPEVSQ
jgi:Asp-tRNA(Asn)/Glu-tRNA(Gln) amidotransferase B subunit